MAPDPDSVFKALRLVPEFDGNPNVLTRFVRLCEQLVISYQNADEIDKLCLINGILNKITGPAARTINSNGIPETWIGIKNTLINNFTDQRDETTLYNDLAIQTQGSSSPQEFYDKCQTLFSTIMTYVTLHETVATTVYAKRDLYKKLTMQSFVRGLKEPLGSRIRCMRPETIEKALEYVQEELNTMYLQQRNDNLPKNNLNSQNHYKPPVHSPMPYVPNVPRPFVFNSNVPRFSNMPHQLQNRPAFNHSNPQRFNPQQQPRMPTRTQQMFSAPVPNYNPRSNVFKLSPRPFNNSPKPMSGVSHFANRVLPHSAHDWSKHGNPPPSSYFKTRDVNVNECASHYDNYCDYPEFYEPTCDTESYYYACDPYNEYEFNYVNNYESDEPSQQQLTYDCEHQEANPQPSCSRAQDFQLAPKQRKSK